MSVPLCLWLYLPFYPLIHPATLLLLLLLLLLLFTLWCRVLLLLLLLLPVGYERGV